MAQFSLSMLFLLRSRVILPQQMKSSTASHLLATNLFPPPTTIIAASIARYGYSVCRRPLERLLCCLLPRLLLVIWFHITHVVIGCKGDKTIIICYREQRTLCVQLVDLY
uniref:Secreted protein n=1 Tax=Lactuca sativa TaxID=4236 RepID=A0A9R1URR1_LACSA|nr:hypothetical protein LSAT_V11C800450280 [Lactuca sativa]